jgi:hypothetical protein
MFHCIVAFTIIFLVSFVTQCFLKLSVPLLISRWLTTFSDYLNYLNFVYCSNYMFATLCQGSFNSIVSIMLHTHTRVAQTSQPVQNLLNSGLTL